MRTSLSRQLAADEALVRRESQDWPKAGSPVRGVEHCHGKAAIFRKAACACGGGCPSCQSNSGSLKISQPNDPVEIEADQIADRVMRNADPGNMRVALNPETILPKYTSFPNGGPFVDDHVGRRINSVKGSGASLDPGTQRFMEARFSTDFGGVRIHQGNDASDLNRELNASAFTVGNDIYFNQSEYSPNTEAGKYLLAHELAHVVQHRRAGSPSPTISRQPASPQDKTLVEQAKKKLEKLEPILAELESKQLEID